MKNKEKCKLEILKAIYSKTRNQAVSFIEFNNSLPSLSRDPLTVQELCFELEKSGYITLKRKWVRYKEIDHIEQITNLTHDGFKYLKELTERYSWCGRLKRLLKNPCVVCVVSTILKHTVELFYDLLNDKF